MGGSNSGRHGGKSTTRGRNTLDVRKLQRDGVLIPGYRFESSWTRNGQPNGAISVVVNESGVHLIYRHGGDTGQDMNYPVLIDWTPCNYGGKRAWWKCPWGRLRKRKIKHVKTALALKAKFAGVMCLTLTRKRPVNF